MALKIRPGETIEAIYRQTELVLVKPAILILALLCIPWYFGIRYNVIAQYAPVFVGWTLIVALYAGLAYYRWNTNRYIITSERVISNTALKLFHVTITEAPLGQITAVRYHSNGIFSTLFDFGTVDVVIAGVSEPIILTRIRDPHAIKEYIWKIAQLQSPHISNTSK